MIVAVASGKGGTGKTTVATGLALSLEKEMCFLDCDVEEPNAHLLLHPVIASAEPVYLPVPVFVPDRCSGCGYCLDVCNYNALALIADKVIVFEQMCHGCGGCIGLCPTGTFEEGRRAIGVVEEGRTGKIFFAHGKLNVGEALVPPIIKNLRQRLDTVMPTVIDCPPGASCPVVQSVRGVDFCLAVTEPTPFGRHDLEAVVEMLKILGVPCGVVINRADLGDAGVKDFCNEKGIPVLAEIPFDEEVVRSAAAGVAVTERNPSWRRVFRGLWGEIERLTNYA
ncbi:MAG: ATP-binding protein [Bacillota bacterium]